MANMKELIEIRNENKGNPNYPSIYWIDKYRLHLRIGEFERNDMTVEEVIEKFRDNKFVMTELAFLLETKVKQLNLLNPSNIENEAFLSDRVSGIEFEIKEKINEIIFELGLKKSNDVMTQLRNCCLVHKYIVEHVEYKDSIMKEKENLDPNVNIRTMDLYNALIKNVGVCSSNSIMFQEILRKIGVKVECVGLVSKDDMGHHMANLVELNGEYYFFDTTLEAYIFEEHRKKGHDLVLCCAGLGTREYCQFYEPKVIMPIDPNDSVKEIPTNISESRIPQILVNEQITENLPTKGSKI